MEAAKKVGKPGPGSGEFMSKEKDNEKRCLSARQWHAGPERGQQTSHGPRKGKRNLGASSREVQVVDVDGRGVKTQSGWGWGSSCSRLKRDGEWGQWEGALKGRGRS
ncbi:hypothetical protein J3458_002786 [Metarhizium acridum]|uniref:uncharacterized protein n=1 Tax=Metarhizium acridum TaxID=92637 RepID=UPI001C6AD878|nr:hypothetical protein J3458_002786 [Metarhizium acridum]